MAGNVVGVGSELISGVAGECSGGAVFRPTKDVAPGPSTGEPV